MLSPHILLETASFIAINKPAMWVVNEALTAHGNPTVQDWVAENCSFTISKDKELRNGIVHRLDKETSGVLLIAKTHDALLALQKQFAERQTVKVYEALVHGQVRGGGTIDAPIARMKRNKTHFGIDKEGKSATTEFNLIKAFKKDNQEYSLVRVHPKTGRTHQIRVHMAHIHHPVVSDPLYVGRNTLRQDLEWCNRMFLHAQSITITDPATQKALTIESPLPPDLENALEYLSNGTA